jgi:hypothetical protein
VILVVHELVTTLKQEISLLDKDLLIHAIRPHIYRHNFPTGSLNLEVWDSNQRTIAVSSSVAIASIGTENYFHGYIEFPFVEPLKALSTYWVALKASGGYTFSESAYIGWCNDYDLRKVDADYTPNDGVNGALDMEFWVKKRAIRR